MIPPESFPFFFSAFAHLHICTFSLFISAIPPTNVRNSARPAQKLPIAFFLHSFHVFSNFLDPYYLLPFICCCFPFRSGFPIDPVNPTFREIERLRRMRMSCNGCRVLRKGCSENCSIRPCLDWIKNAESQANATVFLAKFYGRAGLTTLIDSGPQHLRPAIFRSLLYEACGRMVNPIYGAVGLLWSGNWETCQAAVESILKGCPIHPMISPSGAMAFTSTGNQITEQPNNNNNKTNLLLPPSPLMQSIATELHKVKTKGRFKQPKKVSKLPKEITQIISDAEAASEICNLQWGQSYPGEEDAPHCLVSSDSSSESEHYHCNHGRESRVGFEPKTLFCTINQHEVIVPPAECESDLELELTLCCHSPVLKQSNIPCL